jgi:KDO2-lipid IV(A) lauroyltransferase
MAELLWLGRAGRADIEALVELDEGSRRRWMEATARGRGVILVGIHFGRWELMFLGANLGGQSFALVTRPLANPYLDEYLARIRSRLGNSVLHVGNTRSMHARLARGDALLISMDHLSHKRSGSVFDFLGQPTRLTTGIARLAVRHQASLLPIYALPGREGRLRIEIGSLLEFTASGDRRRDVERITQQSADVLGALIREHPHYWMWSHKRLWRRDVDRG